MQFNVISILFCYRQSIKYYILHKEKILILVIYCIYFTIVKIPPQKFKCLINML